ncbi:basic salivary proline-rich protein 3-like [Psammomys obesus]|uniref:basic salivary proline-rich protein 3-like n=1 Tax=Psammomys obesus TaxID=48139 RepID=UPI002453156E|nr:basic salivary proline-rich protein 3-like [Psammomys obesus]
MRPRSTAGPRRRSPRAKARARRRPKDDNVFPRGQEAARAPGGWGFPSQGGGSQEEKTKIAKSRRKRRKSPEAGAGRGLQQTERAAAGSRLYRFPGGGVAAREARAASPLADSQRPEWPAPRLAGGGRGRSSALRRPHVGIRPRSAGRARAFQRATPARAPGERRLEPPPRPRTVPGPARGWRPSSRGVPPVLHRRGTPGGRLQGGVRVGGAPGRPPHGLASHLTPRGAAPPPPPPSPGGN